MPPWTGSTVNRLWSVAARPKSAGWHHTVAGGVAALAFLIAPPSAHASPQGLPPDVRAGWSDAGDTSRLPPPPEGYESEDKDGVTWVYPEAAVSSARDLQQTFDSAWARITRDLGASIDHRMTIRIGRNPEEMRALAPEGHPPPGYATGVAYTSYGVILLTLTAPQTWERPAIDKVLTHELSHIALRRAVDGNPLPKWFVEGVAIHQAGEASFGRFRVLWSATVSDDLISLSKLSSHFPGRPHQVDLAYAQSADVVRFLRDRPHGANRFQRLIRNLRGGEQFDTALQGAYFITPRQLEDEWRAELNQRFQALPLVVGGGGLWVVAGALVVAAFVRRRRRHRRKLDDWAEQEAELDRLEQTAARRAGRRQLDDGASLPDPSDTWQHTSLNDDPGEATNDPDDDEPDDDEPGSDEPSSDEPGSDERMVIYVSGDPPNGREPDVPTVEHEGRDHTLH